MAVFCNTYFWCSRQAPHGRQITKSGLNKSSWSLPKDRGRSKYSFMMLKITSKSSTIFRNGPARSVDKIKLKLKPNLQACLKHPHTAHAHTTNSQQIFRHAPNYKIPFPPERNNTTWLQCHFEKRKTKRHVSGESWGQREYALRRQ